MRNGRRSPTPIRARGVRDWSSTRRIRTNERYGPRCACGAIGVTLTGFDLKTNMTYLDDETCSYFSEDVTLTDDEFDAFDLRDLGTELISLALRLPLHLRTDLQDSRCMWAALMQHHGSAELKCAWRGHVRDLVLRAKAETLATLYTRWAEELNRAEEMDRDADSPCVSCYGECSYR